jgi:integral membrane protein
MNKKLSWLRKAGIAEGISFLLLLGIAMPLKYLLKQPMAVTIVGWAHGILFVAFLFLAWEVKTDRNKSWKWFALAFLAAIIPAGTFFFDKKLKEEQTISSTQPD